MRLRSCTLAAVAGLPSCSSTDQIVQRYNQFYYCEGEQPEVGNVPKGYWVDGCGGRVTFVCVELEHCQAPALVIAQRHGKQFECRRGDVQVRALGGEAWEAKGCGQTMTYQCIDPYKDAKGELHAMRCIAETSEVVSRPR